MKRSAPITRGKPPRRKKRLNQVGDGDLDALTGPSPASSSPAAGTPITDHQTTHLDPTDKTTAEPGATGRRS